MVADVLEPVAEGLAWESIIEGWHNIVFQINNFTRQT
jgi:hypothetical protein